MAPACPRCYSLDFEHSHPVGFACTECGFEFEVPDDIDPDLDRDQEADDS